LTEEEKRERIRYYGDWIKSLWIGVLALSGGLAGLALGLDNRPRTILFAIGVVAEFLLFIAIALLHRSIERLMKALGREGP
jgi:hypothetical protein